MGRDAACLFGPQRGSQTGNYDAAAGFWGFRGNETKPRPSHTGDEANPPAGGTAITAPSRVATVCGDEHHAELVAVQGGGVRLIVQPPTAHVRRWRVVEELFLGGVLIEPCDGA